MLLTFTPGKEKTRTNPGNWWQMPILGTRYSLHCFQTFLSYRMTTHSFNVLMFTAFILIWIPNDVMVKNVALTFWVWNPLRCLTELWYLTNPGLHSLWGFLTSPMGHFQNACLQDISRTTKSECLEYPRPARIGKLSQDENHCTTLWQALFQPLFKLKRNIHKHWLCTLICSETINRLSSMGYPLTSAWFWFRILQQW